MISSERESREEEKGKESQRKDGRGRERLTTTQLATAAYP